MKVIGAGLGRTGTTSLKVALELLLGGPCYHMVEAFEHPEHVAEWQAAVRGEQADLASVLAGYEATVDWPGGALWPELRALWPEAIVLLSVRESAMAWWTSAEATIFEGQRRAAPPESPLALREGLPLELTVRRLTPDWEDRQSALDAYEAYNQRVRDGVPPELLVEWCPGDGWEPLCAALDVPVPDVPFPHLNQTAEFLSKYNYVA
jgi:hypothetical protein